MSDKECKETFGRQDTQEEGDDTVSAVNQNYVYQAFGKRGTEKAEPVVSKDRLEKIKEAVGKYLSDDRK